MEQYHVLRCRLIINKYAVAPIVISKCLSQIGHNRTLVTYIVDNIPAQLVDESAPITPGSENVVLSLQSQHQRHQRCSTNVSPGVTRDIHRIVHQGGVDLRLQAGLVDGGGVVVEGPVLAVLVHVGLHGCQSVITLSGDKHLRVGDE
jgi:hypothetical protein